MCLRAACRWGDCGVCGKCHLEFDHSACFVHSMTLALADIFSAEVERRDKELWDIILEPTTYDEDDFKAYVEDDFTL